jgi:hypothetical protein
MSSPDLKCSRHLQTVALAFVHQDDELFELLRRHKMSREKQRRSDATLAAKPKPLNPRIAQLFLGSHPLAILFAMG